MKISIIIPTLNAQATIGNLLTAIRGQTLSPEEIIIIDSESYDNTPQIAKRYGARVIRIKRVDFGHGRTRNLAASKAKGEILVFLTQDALLATTDTLENLVGVLQQPDVAASYGRQLPRSNAMPLEKFARNFNYPDKPILKSKKHIKKLGIKTFFFSNVYSAIKKREFEEVGGFPDDAIANEDMVLAARLVLKGYKVAYVPEAEVLHSHNYNLINQLKRYFDIGVSLNRNRWILNYVSATPEGIRFLKEELEYLWKSYAYNWIPYALLEALVKYFGFKLGLAENALPIWLKKKLSMNWHFWNQ